MTKMVRIEFVIPEIAENPPFIFRRNFLAAIRRSIAEAHIDGTIDSALAIECLRALPAVEP